MWKACLVILLPLVLADSRPVLRPERATTVPVKKDPFTGPPKPFAFRYGVADVDSGSNFDHAQKQDSSGVVTGEYRVNLPDGRVQIVTYEASAEKGYVAKVRYEGKATYPDTPVKKSKRNKRKNNRKVKNPHMKFKEMKERYPEQYKAATFDTWKSPNLYI